MKKSKVAAIVSQKCRNTWEDLEISPHHVMHIITWLEELGMKPPYLELKFDRSLGESFTNLKNYKWDQEDVG